MSASKKAKAAGFKTLAEVSRISTYHVDTLTRLEKDQPIKFNVILLGSLASSNEAKGNV